MTYSGERNPYWKGGRSVASNGYVLVRRPEHPLADVRGYVYEHRLILSDTLGRLLRKGEQVHHVNGDKQDNRPENLELCASRAHHSVKHRKRDKNRQLPGEPNPTVECACGCGAAFPKYDLMQRPRMFVSGHNARKR